LARRVAFLIGNQEFLPLPESGLEPLQGPANDVAALARVLRDPDRGKFEVHEFLNKPSYEILPNIERALSAAAKGDLVLIFYSGHGRLGRRDGRLYLATADTREDARLTSSIPARHLTHLVEANDCGQVVLILDCCYSGAVDSGLRGDVSSELQVIDDAQGFCIMTATTSTKPARETQLVTGGAVMGRFTAALVNGIESGAADLGRKGKILLSDLRHHLGRVVTGQTPQFFDRRASGDPLISLSPATVARLLGSDVHSNRSRTTRFRDVWGLPRKPDNRTWYRLIRPEHYATALSSAHNKKVISRWNAGSLLDPAAQFATLYFADDPIVAQFEMQATLGSLAAGNFVTNPAISNFMLLNVRITLGEVIDLTDVENCQIPLGISAQELTGDWRGYVNRGRHTRVPKPIGISPTQELGKALFDTNIKGFLTISSRVPDHNILVVFIDNLRIGSCLFFADQSGTIVHQIP
jgi:uncharacterized caspase-like protein